MKTARGHDCVTCNECGTVAFAVSLDYAKKEIELFNKYYDSLPRGDQEMFMGRAKLSNYTFCWCKNPYTNFRAAKEGDCPEGVTMSPILEET